MSDQSYIRYEWQKGPLHSVSCLVDAACRFRPKNVQPVNAREGTTEEDRKGVEAPHFHEGQPLGPKQEGIKRREMGHRSSQGHTYGCECDILGRAAAPGTKRRITRLGGGSGRVNSGPMAPLAVIVAET